MRRIAVIGAPGSGKTTFAALLAERSGIKHYNLDDYLFDGASVEVNDAEFAKRHEEIIKLDEWIVDGISTKTIEERMDRATAVVLLDFPFWIFFAGVMSRGVRRAFGDRRSLPAKVQLGNNYRWRPSWRNLRRLAGFRYREWPAIERAVAARPHLAVYRFYSRRALDRALSLLLRDVAAGASR